jgi:hypothetical protein
MKKLAKVSLILFLAVLFTEKSYSQTSSGLGTYQPNYNFVEHIYDHTGYIVIGARFKTTRKCKVYFQSKETFRDYERVFEANKTFEVDNRYTIIKGSRPVE